MDDDVVLDWAFFDRYIQDCKRGQPPECPPTPWEWGGKTGSERRPPTGNDDRAPQGCKVCLRLTVEKQHNHYGAKVCSSCRGFFRRSVQSQQHPLFVCLPSRALGHDNDQGRSRGPPISREPPLMCLIDSRSRRSCKRCRFDRCLTAGMRPGWVWTDMERKLHLMNRGTAAVVAHATTAAAAATAVPVRSVTLRFTEEERRHVEKIQDLIFSYGYSRYYQTFGQDLEIFKALVEAIYWGQSVPYKIIKKIEAIDKEAMVEKGGQLLETVVMDSGFNNSNRVTMDLIRVNCSSLMGFYWAVFCEPCDMEEFMAEFVAYGMEHPKDAGVEALMAELRNLNVSGRKSAWTYHMLYSTPWASGADIEDRHYHLSKLISRWPRVKPAGDGQEGHHHHHRCNGGKIDRAQFALLTVIMLLSHDTLPASSGRDKSCKAKVEAQQLNYVTMLQRYLKDLYPWDRNLANSRLGEGLMIISQAREVYQMHSKMLPV